MFLAHGIVKGRNTNLTAGDERNLWYGVAQTCNISGLQSMAASSVHGFSHGTRIIYVSLHIHLDERQNCTGCAFLVICNGLIRIIPSHTGQTDTKPTSNRQKSSCSGRGRFIVGIYSVLWVWGRFMFWQTNLSGRHLSNMFDNTRRCAINMIIPYVMSLVYGLPFVSSNITGNQCPSKQWHQS